MSAAEQLIDRTLPVQYPCATQGVLHGPARYRGLFGGRGSGKSRTFALRAAVRAASESRLRILCAREFQTTIKDSVHAEIVATIEEHGLQSLFDIGDSYIRARATGSEFLYTGLRRNVQSLRSKARVDICLLEEAEYISEESYRVLGPTIRTPGSEIWLAWNPETEGSATDVRFRQKPPPTPDECLARGLDPARHAARIARLGWEDNPWFPAELDAERQRDLALSPDLYEHIWGGGYLEISDAKVLGGKWRSEDFEPGEGWDGPYYGLDWGFAQDPTAAVEVWRHAGCLWIRREAGRPKLTLDDTGPFVRRRMPGIEQHTVRADSARPESIVHVRGHDQGLPRIEAAKKWSGSVQDGIAHLRSYRAIVVHPECVETRRECARYSHQVNSAGDPLPGIVDAWNHYIDAIRYALGPLIRPRNAWGVV